MVTAGGALSVRRSGSFTTGELSERRSGSFNQDAAELLADSITFTVFLFFWDAFVLFILDASVFALLTAGCATVLSGDSMRVRWNTLSDLDRFRRFRSSSRERLSVEHASTTQFFSSHTVLPSTCSITHRRPSNATS